MGQRWDKLRGTTSSAFSVGNGRPGNKSFQFGFRDLSLPEVRWNDTLGGLEFTEDGTHYFPLGTLFLPVTFASMSEGYFGYFSSNNTVSKTDAADENKARLAGAHVGVTGRLMAKGVVPAAVFSTASGTPLPNSPVYLARADDEGGLAAAGKLTTVRPYPYVTEAGLVVSVDPLTFPVTRVAAVLLRPRTAAPLEVVGGSLIGDIDGANLVFTTPDKFLREVGGRTIRVMYNGVRQEEGLDYTLSESGGLGTGYDTVTVLDKPPKSGDRLLVDYYKR
jgi:hypothetical protein